MDRRAPRLCGAFVYYSDVGVYLFKRPSSSSTIPLVNILSERSLQRVAAVRDLLLKVEMVSEGPISQSSNGARKPKPASRQPAPVDALIDQQLQSLDIWLTKAQ